MANNNAEVKLDKRLRKTVYRVLEHFLKIMATTYDLTNSKRSQMKLMLTNFAFGEDGGIQGYLGTLETLVSDFTGAQISVIVQNLSEAAKSIRSMDKKIEMLAEAAERQTATTEKQTMVLDQLSAATASRTDQEREKKDRELIRKTLDIDETSVTWNRQSELWESHVAGSGQWLLEKPYFIRWADPKATAAEMILLKAPSGYGKSHLTSIVIQNLLDKHRGDARVVVTYYYLQRDASEKSSPLSKALKTIIWQVSRSSREYSRIAVKLCETSTIDTGSIREVFKKLISDVANSVDFTLFLILDGLDEVDKGSDLPDLVDIVRQIREIADDKTSHLKVRAFVAGTKDALDSIKKDAETSLPEVNLEPNPQDEEPSVNQGDLELFVADRLANTERLQDLDSELSGRIRRELARGARGAYSRLNYLLDDLVRNTVDLICSSLC